MSDEQIKQAIQEAIAPLKREIALLTEYIRQFETASQVNPNVKRTLGIVISADSDKLADSEDVDIDEAGVATHVVLGSPDKFIKIGDVNVPAWN